MPPTTGRDGETERPQNQELVTKRGTTLSTAVLNNQTNRPICVCVSSVWEERAFFSPTLNNYINTLYASESPSLQVSSLHSDLGLKRE